MHVGGLRLKAYLHRMNLKILQAIQPPPRHPALSPLRMRRLQLHANLRYRTALSRLQLLTLRWPNVTTSNLRSRAATWLFVLS